MSLRNTQKKDFDTDSEDDYCEYDSTWEDENKTVRKKKKTLHYNFSSRNSYAAKDMQDFRHSCKNLDGDDEPENQGTTDLEQSNMEDRKGHFYNLDFYKGSKTSEPDDVSISQFHKEWRGEYTKLERVHSYIQWLFPIQEKGMNWQSYVLTKQEIKHFREDKIAKQNLLKSYELMLDFYGIRLVNKKTGDVKRADNWKERFDNMNRNTHNSLRITRILKCLGTLGFEHYQEKLVRFFLHETLVEKTLPNVKKSVLDYFMFAVLDKSQRQDLVRFAFKHFRPRKDFVWGPKKILLAEITNKTGIATENESEAFEKNRSLEEESSRMEEGVMMPTSTNSVEDSEGDRITSEMILSDPSKNESIASEMSTTSDKEHSCQEEGEDTGKDGIGQERAENKSTESGGKKPFNGEPIKKQETGVIQSTPTNNPAEDAREDGEQKVKSSLEQCCPVGSNSAVQHDQEDSAVEMPDVSDEQSDPKEQIQTMEITESDMTVEQTSNGSDGISQDENEDHQVGSEIGQGDEMNGNVKQVTRV